MKARTVVEKLVDMARSFNTASADVLRSVKRSDPTFESYRAEVQQKYVDAARQKLRAETTATLADVRKSIDSELQAVPLTIASIRYPNTTSKDSAARVAGEMQLAASRAFLAVDPSPDALAMEVKEAFAMQRIDYASELVGRATSLHVDLRQVLESWEGTAKLVEIEREAALLQIASRMADTFSSQLNQKAERVVLVDAWPLMNEQERVQGMAALESRGSNLEAVSARMRVAEAMTGILSNAP